METRVRAARSLPLIAAVALPSLFGALVVVLQRSSGPVLLHDELGFLAHAVWLSSRSGLPNLIGTPFYPPSYSLLLAGPLSILPFDPWVIAVGLNIVLLGVVGLLLYWLTGQLLALSPWARAAVSVAASFTPAVVLQTPRAWAEIAVTASMIAWVAAFWRYANGPRSFSRSAVVLVLAEVSFAIHQRSLAILGVSLAIVLGRELLHQVGALRSRTIVRREALEAVGLVALAVGLYLAIGAFNDLSVQSVYHGDYTGVPLMRRIRELDLNRWVVTAICQTWSAAVTTLGIGSLGAIALTRMVRDPAKRLWALGTGASIVGTLLISVTFLQGGTRIDPFVNERYIAPLVPVLVLLGLGALVGRRSGGESRRSDVTKVVIGTGLLSLLIVVRYQGPVLTGEIQAFVIPVLSSFEVVFTGWNALARTIHVAAIALVSLTLLSTLDAMSGSRIRAYVPVVVGAMFVGLAALGSAGALRAHSDGIEDTGIAASDVLAEADIDELLVTPEVRLESRNSLQYRLEYLPIRFIELTSRCPDGRFLLAPDADSLPDAWAESAEPVADVLPFPGTVFELDCASSR